jgi:hypothetical protein
LTVQEAIERANDMRAGNSAPEEMKIRWLSELDGVIYNDVILTHEVEAKGFADYTDVTEELIAEKPYDVLYVYWLMAQIDLKASELNKYNNSLALFNGAMRDYKAWFNRTHMPQKKRQIRLCIDGG